MSIEPLAVKPQTLSYSAREPQAEKELTALLRQHERMTDTVPVSKLGDVSLSSEGLIRGKFRLSTLALSQLCGLLAPGFSQAVFSLAGLRQVGQDAKDERFDNQIAIRVFNELLAFRFARVTGYQLVVDRHHKRVEGLIGRKYNFFSNWEMYDRVRRFVKQRKTAKAGFTEAILSGRRMVLRFRSVDPIFEVTEVRESGEPFFGGYQFENTEVGECALRGSTVLIRQWCDNKAVAPCLESNRVRHVRGAAFERNFTRLLDRLDLRAGEAAQFKDQVLRLLKTRLELGGEQAQHDERLQAIREKLLRRRMSKGLVQRIVQRMLVAGSYRADAADRASTPPLETYARRNAYDLFNALTFEAKREALDERIEAEQLAYLLLVGKFHI